MVIFLRKILFCPRCEMPLYPTDDKKKFFLFSCRACNYKEQLDFEFSWENHKVNKRSILPAVKDQVLGTCCPNAVVTAVEARVNFNRAVENKDLAEEEEERKTGSKYDGSKGYKLNECLDILAKRGIATANEYRANKWKENDCCRAKSFTQENASFSEISEKILMGNVLFTPIPVTEQWRKLEAGDMYVADVVNIKFEKKDGITECWHAIVLVGFGQKDGIKYFSFQNSYGTGFCDEGFGSVRAKEICEVTRFEPY